MKLRTRLFCAWGLLTLLLWGGVFQAVQRPLARSFERSARQSFAGTKRALARLDQERSSRMRQACTLLMQIPELRALIAEHSYELQSGHTSSLPERLDHLAEVVEASFVCALGADGAMIARSRLTPWMDAGLFADYAGQSTAAGQLVRTVFGATGEADVTVGLWAYDGKLYHVVAAPLMFQQVAVGEPGPIEGALLIGSPLTDRLAADLGESQECAVSFVTDGMVTASSLPKARRAELAAKIVTMPPTQEPFESTLSDETYLSVLEPLVDPCSHAAVGAMVIQQSQREFDELFSALWRKTLIIAGVGLLLAGAGSFLLSTAVTRPIRRLLDAVRRIAAGDLEHAVSETRSDELGELGAAVNEMISQLRNRRQLEMRVVEVETATRTKSEFFANMSHEIRTPMTAILGFTDLLGSTSISEDERSDYVHVIRRNGKHLLSIIDDILDLSKIEAGQMQVERIAFSPCEVLSDVASLMRVRAGEKGLGFQVKLETPVPATVTSDPTRLRQVLINLVGNAIKFTETGCVRIVASMVESKTGESARMQFAVIDSGIGMSVEHMGRIFEPFSQADTSTSRRFGGTGLGLSICRKLVAMLGGTLMVDSTVNVGSVFTFTIETGTLDGVARVSRFDEAFTAGHADAEAEPTPLLRGRVLLAEDGDDNRRLLRYYLTAAGVEVIEAENGRQACDMAISSDAPADLVLMDMFMPQMDGYEATRRLRELGFDCPIIALTASAMPEDEARCRRAGCTDYLSKPVSREQLIQTLSRYLPAANSATMAEEVVQLDDAVAPFLAKYVDGLPQKVDQLLSAMRQGDVDALGKQIHSIKGSGGLFGYMNITEQAAAAEASLRDPRGIQKAGEQINELIRLIRSVTGYDPANESADAKGSPHG